jgi:hypothetical protein
MQVEMTFRSGWERSYFMWLDANPEVIAYYSEPFKIPYVSNTRTGKVRGYIPDLLVEYAGRKLLVEIKPSKRMGNVVNRKKFAAARLWCTINGVEFVVITEKELKTLGLL